MLRSFGNYTNTILRHVHLKREVGNFIASLGPGAPLLKESIEESGLDLPGVDLGMADGNSLGF